MSGVRYQKTYVTKPAVADSEVDLPGYMKIEIGRASCRERV